MMQQLHILVFLCLQVQGYCQVQDSLLLLLPASCIGHVHGMHNLYVPFVCTAYGDFCVSLYKLRVAICMLFRGCLSIKVNGRTFGTFTIVNYIGWVTVEVSLLSWLLLYYLNIYSQ